MRILSCGSGMQSTALALMSCENAMTSSTMYLPVYDAVIFCDLGFEPPWVMRQTEFIRSACQIAGIPFVILDSPLHEDLLRNFGERRTVSIPWWTLRADGHKAKMPRNCTSACTFCPFHKNAFFQYLRENEPEQYQKLFEVDCLLRDKNPKSPMDSDLFISYSRKRLYELTPEDCEDGEYFEYRGERIWNGF